MISAAMCKVHTLANIERYCSENIEPLLLEANGQAIDFGKYNEDGTVEYYISKTYAKDCPGLEPYRYTPVNPLIIKTFLEVEKSDFKISSIFMLSFFSLSLFSLDCKFTPLLSYIINYKQK